MRGKKILKVLVPILTIFFIICFIISILIPNKNNITTYWISTWLLAFVIYIEIYYWSKIGLDADKKESSMIKRIFDDNTAILGVFYGTLLCIISFIDTFNQNILKTNYAIITMFIMTIEFELFTNISIKKAKKDTAKLLKGNK